MSDRETARSRPRPIFIVGMTGRTGTKYLTHLFRLHPDCAGRYSVSEEGFLYRLQHLAAYTHALHAAWSIYDPTREGPAHLSRCLGDGVVQYMVEHSGASRPVTNTPSLRNLSHFFSFFPDAYLILLVRNGRDVVESMAKSFSIPLTKGMRDWAEAANHILAYDRANRDSGLRYAIVRYEDLAANVCEVMHRLLRFADLDPDQYDFDAAAQAPIIGSSVVFGPVTQGTQPMTAGFEPHKRTLAWSRRIQARFAWLAGRQSHELGYRYDKERTAGLWWLVYNVCCDVLSPIVDCWRRLVDRPQRVARRRLVSLR